MKPGAKGTRKLLRDFGDRLVCVRYRYDEAARMRLTTVELVVSEARRRPRTSRLVLIEVRPWELSVRESVKKAGARWEPGIGLWRMRYDRVVKLGLRERIRPDPGPKKSLSAETRKSLPAETSPENPRKVSITADSPRRLI
jgi:hypothetical protein